VSHERDFSPFLRHGITDQHGSLLPCFLDTPSSFTVPRSHLLPCHFSMTNQPRWWVELDPSLPTPPIQLTHQLSTRRWCRALVHFRARIAPSASRIAASRTRRGRGGAREGNFGTVLEALETFRILGDVASRRGRTQQGKETIERVWWTASEGSESTKQGSRKYVPFAGGIKDTHRGSKSTPR